MTQVVGSCLIKATSDYDNGTTCTNNHDTIGSLVGSANSPPSSPQYVFTSVQTELYGLDEQVCIVRC